MISVLDRSPPELIHEIILVDDFSDHGNNVYKTYTCLKNPLPPSLSPSLPSTEDLQKKLENWIATNPKIKLLRHSEREGLISARMTGALAATGDVMVFLDSHCEANVGWLEPLLVRIKVHIDC